MRKVSHDPKSALESDAKLSVCQTRLRARTGFEDLHPETPGVVDVIELVDRQTDGRLRWRPFVSDGAFLCDFEWVEIEG
jgi:hypothetical protein